MRSLPVQVVGRATAQEARQAAFQIETIGNGGIEALLRSLAADLGLLHLCGEHRRWPTTAQQRVTSLVVYRAKESFAPNLAATSGAIALIHSPRAGQRFAELVAQRGRDRRTIAIVTISSAAADAVGRGWQTVEVADNTNDDAVLALAERINNESR